MKTFKEVEDEFKNTSKGKPFADMAEYCYLLTRYIEDNYNLIPKEQ